MYSKFRPYSAIESRRKDVKRTMHFLWSSHVAAILPRTYVRFRTMHIRPDHEAQDLFAQAYEEYADAIFRHCYFHTFRREDAKEIMQETFMKTWEYIASGKEVEQVRPFLYRTATNLIINASKKKKEASLDAMQEEGFDPGAEDEKHGRDVIQEERVLKTLSQLEEPYRQAVMLRYIEDLSPAEIADILGETPNVVSVRIHRGLKQLKSLLQVHG